MKLKRFLIVILLVSVFLGMLNPKILAVENKLVSYEKIDLIEKELEKYMENFKGDSVPEESKIKEYQVQNLGDFGDKDNKVSGFAQIFITPYTENSSWKKNAIMQDFNGKIFSMIFIEISKNEEGNYVVDYIADTPKNYDKFLKEFEQYKKENPENLQNEIQVDVEEMEKISATETNFSSANEEIAKTSNIIKICCTSAIVVVVIAILYKFTKKYCNKLIKN